MFRVQGLRGRPRGSGSVAVEDGVDGVGESAHRGHQPFPQQPRLSRTGRSRSRRSRSGRRDIRGRSGRTAGRLLRPRGCRSSGRPIRRATGAEPVGLPWRVRLEQPDAARMVAVDGFDLGHRSGLPSGVAGVAPPGVAVSVVGTRANMCSCDPMRNHGPRRGLATRRRPASTVNCGGNRIYGR